jgi:tetratricopeptide (TPR) repeat protein
MSLASVVLALATLTLQIGAAAQRTIATGELQTFAIDAAAGEFVDVVIDQDETDLAVGVVSPDNRQLATYDGRLRGVERLSFVAPAAGVYRLEVRAVGRIRRAAYEVRLDGRRAAQPEDGRVLEAQRLMTAAKQLFQKGDPDSLRVSLQHRRQAATLWNSSGDRVGAIGDTLYSLSEFAAAREEYLEALSLSRALKDRRTEAEVLNNLAMVAWPLGDVTDALALLNEATALWRALDFTYGEAIAVSNHGILLWESGDFQAARGHYARALTLFRSIRDRRGEAYVLNNLAVVLDDLGDRRAALERLTRAITLFRAERETLAEGRALVRRARIQLSLNESRSSLANTRQALRIIRQSGDLVAEADALNHLGRTLRVLGQRGEARAQHEHALELYRRVGGRRGESDALYAIGLLHHDAGDWSGALAFLREALALRQAIGLRGLEAEALFRLGESQRLAGDLDSARDSLRRGCSNASFAPRIRWRSTISPMPMSTCCWRRTGVNRPRDSIGSPSRPSNGRGRRT